MLWTLVKHEGRLLLYSKHLWRGLFGLQVLMASLFYWLITQFEYKVQSQFLTTAESYGITEDAVHPYFAWSVLILILLVPLYSPNTLCHEKKNNTLNLYQMAVVSPTQLVWIKWLVGCLMGAFVTLSLSVMPFSLRYFGAIDWGQIVSCLLALMLVVCSVQAIHILCSSMCKNHLYATLLTFFTILVLIFFEWIAPYVPYGDDFLKEASFLFHIKGFLNGLIQSRDLGYYLAITLFSLVLASENLKIRENWKETAGFLVKIMLIAVCCLGVAFSDFKKDISLNRLNSLQADTETLLAALDSPLEITLAMDEKNARFEDVLIFLDQITAKNKAVAYRVLKPKTSAPDNPVAFLLMTYGEQKKTLNLSNIRLTESVFYQALYQLMHNKQHWVVFLRGHGEHSIQTEDESSYSYFSNILKDNGAFIATMNLQETNTIPDNAQVLILAGNKTPLLPAESALVLDYVRQGGNLLWLLDPHSEKASLAALAQTLQLSASDNAVKPEHSGLVDPHMALVTHYSTHPITQNLENVAVLPWAAELKVQPHVSSDGSSDWFIQPLLTVKEQGESKVLAWSFEREKPLVVMPLAVPEAPQQTTEQTHAAHQRVVVIGNSQFLTNKTILNYANRELAQRVMDWLAYNEKNSQLIPKPAVDHYIEFPLYSRYLYQIIFPLGLGLAFLGMGWAIRRSRVVSG